MAPLKVSIGSVVKTPDGRVGNVRNLQPIRTGGRGRPKTLALVSFDETSDILDEYGVRDLKVVTQAS